MDKLLVKTLNEIDKDIISNIQYIEVDVEQDTELATKYKIRTIPALVIASSVTEEYHSMVGFYLIREIKNFITTNYNRFKSLS